VKLVGRQPIIESLRFFSIRACAVCLEDSLTSTTEDMLEQAVAGVGRRIIAALSIVIWQSEVEARGGVVTITLFNPMRTKVSCQSSGVGLQIVNASFYWGEHRVGKGGWPVRLCTDFFDDGMGGEMLQNTPCMVN
jgi:hypothetical protein